jgi:hypothetical protein
MKYAFMTIALALSLAGYGGSLAQANKLTAPNESLKNEYLKHFMNGKKALIIGK